MAIPQSFIKSVNIQMRNQYSLENTAHLYESTKEDASQKKFFKIPFLGRKKEIDKFLEFLNGSNNGIFLVTGFRGMGKTSFVNHVINEYKNGKEKKNITNSKIIPIHLTLSQNQPKEADILRLMVSTVSNKYLDFLFKQKLKIQIFPRLHKTMYFKLFHQYLTTLVLLGVLLCLLLNYIAKEHIILKNSWLPSFLKNRLISPWTQFISDPATILLVLITSFFFLRFWALRDKNKRNAYNLIQRLVKRCHATLSEEKSSTDEAGLTSNGIGLKFSKSEKAGASFPIATTKEIEFELQLFLKLARDEEELDFIFIFDELDKVDPAISTSYIEEVNDLDRKIFESSYQKSLRERKQAIINIISSLKNFFTGTEARFIFITGREMFDASLADIADRQSSISSIFTYIFYIESLHKEKNLYASDTQKTNSIYNSTSSLSYAIEEILKHMLFNIEEEADHQSKNLYQFALELICKAEEDDLAIKAKAETEVDKTNLDKTIKAKTAATKAKDEAEEAKAKIIILLQSFIIYLTYRSNGSPRKLIRAIQEFIVIRPVGGEYAKNDTCITAYQSNTNENSSTLFLHFGYYDQYRIGFINYLYRPFLIQHGRNFKIFSDNIVISTSYLFDHLLKFHHFAFSKTHLELIPEVLSTNKTTSLREHINEIIKHLYANHLRESDIYLYDYKFYSRTANEIVYLSKIFEDESAALNFTLDESYLVKLHVRGKIKELRLAYSQFDKEGQIFSISHLNSILGDLHFFDQEYDDAIEGYSDAIKPIKSLDMDKINMRDFITLITNKLKLGLCFERMNSYEQALAFYVDSNIDANRFMHIQLAKGRLFDSPINEENENQQTDLESNSKAPIFYSSMLNDLLQIINQSFLATLFIEEKLGIEGISQEKLFVNLGNYFKISESVRGKTLGLNYLMNANVFLFCGKLFYFKNSYEGIENKTCYNLLPDFLKEYFEILYEKLQSEFKDIDKQPKIRRPLIALQMYILGMQEAFNARPSINGQDNISNPKFDFVLENIIKTPNIIYFLVKDIPSTLDKSGETFLASHFRFFASFYSNIGDCLLCLLDNKSEWYIRDVFDIENKLYFKSDNILDFIKESNPKKITLSDVFRCYALSAKYFNRYGRIVSASFQYRKMLHLLRLVLKKEAILPNKSPIIKAILENKFLHIVENCLLEPILTIVSRNAGNSDRHMQNKLEKLLANINKEKSWSAFISNNLSNHPEFREPILLYMLVRLKIGAAVHKDWVHVFISNHNSVATQFTRILELDFHARYKKMMINKSFDIDIEGDGEKINIFIDHAVDYIFNLESILQILKIYGNDFTLGYSYSAYTHFQLAKFLQKVEKKLADKGNLINTTTFLKLKEDIGNKLKNVLANRSSHVIMDTLFHYQMAREAYEKALQLHTGGYEYKKMIGEMIYLEDDFNDNAYHFGACTDRYLISKGVFANNIKICVDYINSKSEYNFSKFVTEYNADQKTNGYFNNRKSH